MRDTHGAKEERDELQGSCLPEARPASAPHCPVSSHPLSHSPAGTYDNGNPCLRPLPLPRSLELAPLTDILMKAQRQHRPGSYDPGAALELPS